jgi:hypothetical protein
LKTFMLRSDSGIDLETERALPMTKKCMSKGNQGRFSEVDLWKVPKFSCLGGSGVYWPGIIRCSTPSKQ